MSAALIYLNPNITKDQADKIFNDSMERQRREFDKVIKEAEKISDSTVRAEYLSIACCLIPYI